MILFPLRRGTFNLGRENKTTVTRSMGFLTEKLNFNAPPLDLRLQETSRWGSKTEEHV